MMQVSHTFYITEPLTTLRLKGKNTVVEHENGKEDLIPLHLVEKIVVFSPKTITLPLMSYCAASGIGLICLSGTGRLKFQVEGETKGNVYVRKKQYTMSESEKLRWAKEMIENKLRGQKENLSRFAGNHPDKLTEKVIAAEKAHWRLLADAEAAGSRDELRGIEGSAAATYYSVLDNLILTRQEELRFAKRTRRPPENCCNAMLSFAYTLLAYDCAAALESFGIDPYVGVFHGERPGKMSMALDMMEEFRPTIADRHVIRLINLGIITPGMFRHSNDCGVFLNEEGRRVFLQEWNKMKRRETFIPDTGKKAPKEVLLYLRAQQFNERLREESA